ncbi:hypothetical protein EDB81DRAFT_868131 [Dactylonectria macrodidyma]|uniref:IPT/TIG domain-containing protein n=1 Tax=Dactylonectria macrodidyma TaxID=307937 RepID=A0A9P9J7Z1_9HYPO|nr:hypothetical protein EDB81DRAFT_868131 [Dactylonectria macrodidyma]
MTSPVSISYFKPESGWPGTTITIIGENFSSHLDENTVYIGDAIGLVLRAYPSELVVLVGDTTRQGPVTVTFAGSTATSAGEFSLDKPPNETDPDQAGPPIRFHGPQRGTPKTGVTGQPVLVLFCHGHGDPPANPAAELAAEQASFDDAKRWWNEATYGKTTVTFSFAGWFELSGARNDYIWDVPDIEAARRELVVWTKRWTAIDGGRAFIAHQGGFLTISDLGSNPDILDTLTSNWVARHVAVSSSVAFVVAGTDGLISILVAGTATEMGRVALGSNLHACDVSADGRVLVAAALDGGVEIYDVSNAFNMVRVFTIPITVSAVPLWATCVKLEGNTLFWGGGNALNIWDVTTPGSPVFQGALDVTPSIHIWITSLDVVGNTCIVFSVGMRGTMATAACGADGVVFFDLADLSDPQEPLEGGSLKRCMASAGETEFAIIDLGGPPVIGPIVQLTPRPGTGTPHNVTKLQDTVAVAIDSQNKNKNHNFIFEGIITVIWGGFGRGASWTSPSVEGTAGNGYAFNGTKGLIWLASGSNWGRKAHEIGHWFGMEDLYSETYSDGTVLDGTAADWDLGGHHDLGPLYSGYHAQMMGLYQPENIQTLRWRPSDGPSSPVFTVVAHTGAENPTTDNGAQIHLLKISVSDWDGLAYYIEVRQRPGGWIFDRNIPLPGIGTTPDGRVLVTRVSTNTSLSNSLERNVSLFGVLDVGESVVDAGRLIKITVNSVVQTNPLAYSITVNINDPPPDDPAGQFDLRITPWSTDTWQTPDIWVNSPRNDRPGTAVYESHEDGDDTKPTLNGDRPWVHHKNTIFARINNDGIRDATDVVATAYVVSPPGVGDNGNWVARGTQTIPHIPAGGNEVVGFDWMPAVGEHTCLRVAVFPQPGEVVTKGNNVAQENVFRFDSPGASSHEPVVVDTMVRSPFTVWRRVDMAVRGLPLGWHAAVDRRWVWVPPLGEVPVRAVIWTDKNSPRGPDKDKDKDKEIPAEAQVRVEGWTHFALHQYRPIGGILVAVRANARPALEVAAKPEGSKGIRVWVRVRPGTAAPVPGAVEVKKADESNKGQIVNFRTNSDGGADFWVDAEPGKYSVTVFTASTPEVAEAESEEILVTVG